MCVCVCVCVLLLETRFHCLEELSMNETGRERSELQGFQSKNVLL